MSTPAARFGRFMPYRDPPSAVASEAKRHIGERREHAEPSAAVAAEVPQASAVEFGVAPRAGVLRHASFDFRHVRWAPATAAEAAGGGADSLADEAQLLRHPANLLGELRIALHAVAIFVTVRELRARGAISALA